MPEFRYHARDLAGKSVRGLLTAADRGDAVAQLSTQQLFPVDLAAVAGTPKKAGGRAIKTGLLARFYVQLSDLLSAGVPLLRAIHLIEEQATSDAFRATISEIRDDISNGKSLAEAFARHPRTFPDFVVSLIEAGEEGSFVEEVLRRIAKITEHQTELRSKIIGAMIYPTFLVCFGTIVVVGMMTYFVPKFAPFFARMDEAGNLPAATSLLLSMSEFLRDYLLLIVAVVGGLAFGVSRYLKTPRGREQRDRFLIAQFQIGKSVVGPGLIFRNLAVARFCRVLGTMLRNGVTMLRSLQIAKNATGNTAIADAIGRTTEQVTGGKSLATPLRGSGEFSTEVVEMIAVGEESNNLDRVLVDIADILERRLTRQLDVMVRLLEPVTLLLLAAVVTFIVAALLLPILQSSTLV